MRRGRSGRPRNAHAFNGRRSADPDRGPARTGWRTMHRGLTRLILAAILPAMVLCGCATVAPVDVRIDRVRPETGYRIAKFLVRDRGPANNPDALLLLAFSGGGTRAAALSYGVLEELRRTPIVVKGHQHSLLDEVDLIAGVSGGSFTALAYALYGERLFQEYQQRFLKRNVQGELIRRILSPAYWLRLARDGYSRSELAADYYDEILFGGTTFSDLIPLQTPVAVVTGTDLSTGARFEFSQDTFDLLCSDLGSLRLARAAATSSAVPVLLSPVTYRNYGGTCDAVLPIWVQGVADKEHAARPAGRALLRYRDFEALEDSANRPHLHIVDGGVSDNLGLRSMLEAFEQLEASPAFQREMRFSELRHIVVIAVNSRSAPATDWDRRPAPPSIVSQLIQASSVPIDHFSFESVELLKDIAARWADRRELAIARRLEAGQSRTEAEASLPRITFDAIDVSFDAIEDPLERRAFMEMPTTFHLPAESIDRLRELGGRLLRNSRAYQVLLERIAELARLDTPSSVKPPAPE
jgi:NTE family protein